MGTRRRYSQCIYTTTDNKAMGDIVRIENNRTIESTKRDNSRTGWGSNRNNGAITMGLPSVYVAQWENLEQWYDIGKERR